MPKIAILLTTFNGQHWLKEQLDSILNQKNVVLDVYISDDLSSDQSPELINTYTQKFNNVIALSRQVKYGSAAQNFFRLIRDVDFSQYSYIALSDQDDIWLPNKLCLAIEAMKSKGVESYSSNIKAFWPDGSTKLIQKAQPQTEFDYMFESAGPGCTFVMSQKLVLEIQALLSLKHTILERVALHDWFIYAFARSKGYKWYIDPTPTLLYRQHSNNVVGANIGFKALKVRISKLTQGWYIQQILLIAKILGYEHYTPIKRVLRLNISDRSYLAIYVNQLRRRVRDRFAFVFFILFLAKKL